MTKERLFDDNTFTMVKNIYVSLYPFAIFIAIMIWYIDVYKQIASSSFDGFSKREFKQLAWSFLGVVFWITNAFGLCIIILKIESGVVSNLVTNDDLIIRSFESTVERSDTGNVFGDFINTVLAWLNNYMTFILLNLIMLVVSLCLVCKLTVRQIELCCMISVSSVFFACMQMKNMKWLFRKFFKSYIFLVCQTIPMALMYLIGRNWVNERMSELTFMNLDSIVIVIGLGCLMLKKSFLYRIFE